VVHFPEVPTTSLLRDFVDDCTSSLHSLLLSTPVDAPVEKQLAPEAADDLWQAVSRLLRVQLGDATYRTWLAGVQALDLQNGVLRLSVPHQVARRRIETSYAEAIA
jgi:hypothetical protein